jgi:TolB-like protein
MLNLHLKGSFRITGPGVPNALSRRGQAMLAFLSQQPDLRAERGRLVDLLWSDRSADQGRASLRQELSVMRRDLPEGVLMADRQYVWLNQDKIASVLEGNGIFLDGFDLPSEGFEDWLRMMRSATEVVPESASPLTAFKEGRPRLAILAFDELGATDADMFADGVVSEITGALSRVNDFHVIARQSAFALRGQPLDIPMIGERLGADYVVEGSVRRSGERVRIAVELVSASDGRALWAQRFDDRMDDLFDLQDRIAAQVAGQIAPNLRAAEIARANQRPAADRTAYELVLTALPHFWAHRREENLKAIELLDAALKHSPDHAPALAYKAWCHAHQCCYLWSKDEATDRSIAIDLLARAAPLVRDDPGSLVALSAASALAADDFVQAEQFADRALALDPNNAWGWLRKGWTTIYLGRPEEALTYLDRAEALSPLDPFHHNVLFGRAAALRKRKRYDEAIELIQRGMRAGPGVVWAYRMLFSALWMAGRKDEALDAARKWRESHPDLTPELMRSLLPKWVHEPEHVELLLKMCEMTSSDP